MDAWSGNQAAESLDRRAPLPIIFPWKEASDRFSQQGGRFKGSKMQEPQHNPKSCPYSWQWSDILFQENSLPLWMGPCAIVAMGPTTKFNEI